MEADQISEADRSPAEPRAFRCGRSPWVHLAGPLRPPHLLFSAVTGRRLWARPGEPSRASALLPETLGAVLLCAPDAGLAIFAPLSSETLFPPASKVRAPCSLGFCLSTLLASSILVTFCDSCVCLSQEAVGSESGSVSFICHQSQYLAWCRFYNRFFVNPCGLEECQ